MQLIRVHGGGSLADVLNNPTSSKEWVKEYDLLGNDFAAPAVIGVISLHL